MGLRCQAHLGQLRRRRTCATLPVQRHARLSTSLSRRVGAASATLVVWRGAWCHSTVASCFAVLLNLTSNTLVVWRVHVCLCIQRRRHSNTSNWRALCHICALHGRAVFTSRRTWNLRTNAY